MVGAGTVTLPLEAGVIGKRAIYFELHPEGDRRIDFDRFAFD